MLGVVVDEKTLIPQLSPDNGTFEGTHSPFPPLLGAARTHARTSSKMLLSSSRERMRGSKQPFMLSIKAENSPPIDGRRLDILLNVTIEDVCGFNIPSLCCSRATSIFFSNPEFLLLLPSPPLPQGPGRCGQQQQQHTVYTISPPPT